MEYQLVQSLAMCKCHHFIWACMKEVRQIRTTALIVCFSFAKFSWKAIHRKFTKKSKTFDEIVDSAGKENVEKFVEK